VQIFLIAQQTGVVKLGISESGRDHGNGRYLEAQGAALRRARKLKEELLAEVERLLAQAEEEDQGDVPDRISLRGEMVRREKHLAVIAEARAEIERRAEEQRDRQKPEEGEKPAHDPGRERRRPDPR
jgi:hypothetical protein